MNCSDVLLHSDTNTSLFSSPHLNKLKRYFSTFFDACLSILMLNKKPLLTCFEKGFTVGVMTFLIYSDDFVLLWMDAILLIYHRKCSCQRNRKLRLIFYFSLRQLLPSIYSCRYPSKAIILFNRLSAFALIVCSRATSTGTLANDFPVLLTLKPPSVKIFVDRVDLFLNWQI